MEGLKELSTLVTISAEFLELLTPEPCALEVKEDVTRVTWGLVTTCVKVVFGTLKVTGGEGGPCVTRGRLTPWITDPCEPLLARAADITPLRIRL